MIFEKKKGEIAASEFCGIVRKTGDNSNLYQTSELSIFVTQHPKPTPQFLDWNRKVIRFYYSLKNCASRKNSWKSQNWVSPFAPHFMKTDIVWWHHIYGTFFFSIKATHGVHMTTLFISLSFLSTFNPRVACGARQKSERKSLCVRGNFHRWCCHCSAQFMVYWKFNVRVQL